MRASFKEADVHALEIEQRDEVQNTIMWEEGESKIGAGEGQHIGYMG
jgi:hypothetical protein